MTQEEAITREEAIRRIKAWNLDTDDLEVLSVLIPELVESEDERIRRAIVLGVRRCADAGSIFGTIINNEGVNYSEVLAWLERQKDLFRGSTEMVEQKPAKWSEEDEMIATSIIYILKNFEHLGATDMRIDWLQNKLKFLHPQPHWKPSEEQMKSLLNAEGKMREIGFIAIASNLAELYEQLKKLM